MISRREQYREETIQAIKTTARQEMSRKGTAGLTLRGIARAMGMTAPALYHYFDNLDDLLTALIVDAYSALADAIEAAGKQVSQGDTRARFRQSLLEYRRWAVDHPTDFQLIYGNPIPGYQAPVEVTRPLARRPFEWLGSLLVEAWQQGDLEPMKLGAQLPQEVAGHLESYIQHAGYEIPVALMYLLVSGWTHVHGMVALEILGHSPPVVGAPESFYANEIDRMISNLGL